MTLPLLLDLPGRDEARQAAERELSKPAYRAAEPSWYERLLHWLLDKLNELLDKAAGHVPGGTLGLVVLVAVLALLAGLVLYRLRPARRVQGGVPLFGWDTERTAQEHRDLAEAHVARGDLRAACQERFRAVVRELESRGVLDPRPGRTADEVAWESGAAVPHLRDALLRGARLFDDVTYGERPADTDGYATLVALDEQVRTARLAVLT